MPIYEYKCLECGKITEWIESINSNSKSASCDHCGNKAKRIISLSTFKLKGTGWYVTDYKNNGKDNIKEGHVDKTSNKASKDIESNTDKKVEPKKDKKAVDKKVVNK